MIIIENLKEINKVDDCSGEYGRNKQGMRYFWRITRGIVILDNIGEINKEDDNYREFERNKQVDDNSG